MLESPSEQIQVPPLLLLTGPPGCIAGPRKRGRPKGTKASNRFQPTESQRVEVKAMKTVGTSNDAISTILGISEETLNKYFGSELRLGKANWQVLTLKKLAEAVLRGEGWAIAFTTKCQFGWREKQVEPIEARPPVDLATMVSTRELEGEAADADTAAKDYLAFMNGQPALEEPARRRSSKLRVVRGGKR